MLTTTLKLNEEINELKGEIFKQIGFDDLINMDKEKFEMMKKVISIMDTSQELMIKQAELIEGIYKKLDELSLKGIER